MLSDRCPAWMTVMSCLSVCLSMTLVYCGQTVRWVKMKLGTEVELGPGHIVLDRHPVPTKRGNFKFPNFRPMSVMVKRLDGLRCHLVRR